MSIFFMSFISFSLNEPLTFMEPFVLITFSRFSETAEMGRTNVKSKNVNFMAPTEPL